MNIAQSQMSQKIPRNFSKSQEVNETDLRGSAQVKQISHTIQSKSISDVKYLFICIALSNFAIVLNIHNTCKAGLVDLDKFLLKRCKTVVRYQISKRNVV